MDAHKALITNIFNNSTLVEVPFFQRSYVWREDLWGRLLEDMEFVVKTKKPHFLGLILSILVYTLFSRMFDLMQPPAVKHSIAVV